MDRSECLLKLRKFEDRHRRELSKRDKRNIVLYRQAIINPAILEQYPNFVESWLSMACRYNSDFELFYELLPAISDQILDEDTENKEDIEARALALANLIYQHPEDQRLSEWRNELALLLEKIC